MDWEKIATLLDVVHKAAAAGPQYTWFGDMAWAELRQIKQNAHAVEAPEKPPMPYIPSQFDLALKGKL